MAAETFYEKLDTMAQEQRFLCVGLDPDLSKLPTNLDNPHASPADQALRYMQEVVAQTADIAGAYKPNSAFYEQYGPEGAFALRGLIDFIKDAAPEVPVILDGKRGDIGNTNNGYVAAHYDGQDADALTINPYLGSVANSPFLGRKDKGVIVLARTSNPGAAEFQMSQSMQGI